MAFMPVFNIRKIRIIKGLVKARVFSEETAKRLDEIGFIFPDAFPGITRRLVERGRIRETKDGKYYINR